MRIVPASGTHRRQLVAQVANQTFQLGKTQRLLGIGRGQRLYGIIDEGEPYFQFRKSLFEAAHNYSGRNTLRPRPIP
jgi:hypothetical protein